MLNIGQNKIYKKEKEEGCVFIYQINLDDKKLAEIENNALLRVQSIVTLPGFRTGKAPLNLVKQKYSSMIRDEVIDLAAKYAVDETIKGENIFPIVTPVISDINYEPSKKLSFKLRFECNPVFEPQKYENIKVTKRIHEITDEDVNKQLELIREYNSYLRAVPENAVIEKNHYVIVDYDVYENGVKMEKLSAKGEMIDMSSPQNIAGMTGAILGAKRGEEKEFETDVDGKKLKFKVKIVDIKEKVVPELDENFIKQSGLNSLDELKAQIRKILEAQEMEKAEKDVIRQIEDALIRENKFPLPPAVVAQETRELFEIYKKQANVENPDSLNIEDYISVLKPIAERNLAITYLLHNIAKKENIKATEEDFQKEMDKVISSLKTEEEIKKVKDIFEARKDYIMASIVENKTFEFIKSKAEIKEIKS